MRNSADISAMRKWISDMGGKEVILLSDADYDTARFQPYFDRLWSNAVQLCAYLIRQYPTIEINEIVSHHEGFLRGTASGHHDPEHWWKFHNKTMDDFRAAVARETEDK